MIDFNNGKVMEQVKESPFFGDYDVVVAGGGVAGAAQQGQGPQAFGDRGKGQGRQTGQDRQSQQAAGQQKPRRGADRAQADQQTDKSFTLHTAPPNYRFTIIYRFPYAQNPKQQAACPNT